MYAHSPIEFSHPLTVHIHPLLGTHSDLLVIYEQTACAHTFPFQKQP